MRPIKISVTNLEAFRRICEEQYAFEGELIDSIKGKRTESWQARAGTGVHSLLERGPLAVGEEFPCGDYLVDQETDAAIRQAVVLPPADERTPECKIYTPIAGPIPVVLSGRIDLLWGSILFDHKCKFSSWAAQDYEPSLQWRLYLLMTGCRCFVYNVLSFYEPKEKGDLLRFKGAEVLRFWAYPAIGEDCVQWIGRFMEWAQQRRLLGYLEMKEK